MSRGSANVPGKAGMTLGQARFIEYAIITLAVVAVLLIFQPFSLALFSVGCVGVVVAGLAFNLIPFCRPGVPMRALLRVIVIVLVILGIAALLGIATAYLYVWYLGTLR